MKNVKLKFTMCHQKPERSFFWKGKQFPVCARCTGIHIGYISFPIFLFSFATLNIYWTLLLILPTVIDGLTQAYFERESTNLIRLVTGLAAGVGAMSLVSIIGKGIGKLILTIFRYFITT